MESWHSFRAPWRAFTRRAFVVFVYQFPDQCLGRFPPRTLRAIYSSHCHSAGGLGVGGGVLEGGRGGCGGACVPGWRGGLGGGGVRTRLHAVIDASSSLSHSTSKRLGAFCVFFLKVFFGCPPTSLITSPDWLFGSIAAVNTPVRS